MWNYHNLYSFPGMNYTQINQNSNDSWRCKGSLTGAKETSRSEFAEVLKLLMRVTAFSGTAETYFTPESLVYSRAPEAERIEEFIHF